MMRYPNRSLVLPTLLLLALLTTSAQAYEFFVHEATGTNTFLFVTQMDHPAVNDKPDVKIQIQPVLNPHGDDSGVDQASYFGLAYSPDTGRWSIETQDISVAMTVGLRFFVFVSDFGLVHHATDPNTAGNETVVDDGSINFRDVGRFGLTYFRSLDGSSGPRNPHPTAMEYDHTTQRWRVINQDGAAMPFGGGFFVHGNATATPSFFETSSLFETSPDAAFDAKLDINLIHGRRHEITGSNTIDELTILDIDAINDLPYSFVFATFDATDGFFNPHPVTVTYDPLFNRWLVYNADGASLPVGGTFMIRYTPVLFFDGFESGDATGWDNAVD